MQSRYQRLDKKESTCCSCFPFFNRKKKEQEERAERLEAIRKNLSRAKAENKKSSGIFSGKSKAEKAKQIEEREKRLENREEMRKKYNI